MNLGTALPITPKQVREQVLESIPNELILAVNKLLTKNYSKGFATIKQDDIIESAITALGIERNDFDFDWLDFEDLYRMSGWDVEYVKASPDSCYSFFEFTAR